jgi:hypothetical protein
MRWPPPGSRHGKSSSAGGSRSRAGARRVDGQHVGKAVEHPARRRRGGRAQNDLQTRARQRFEGPVHPGPVESVPAPAPAATRRIRRSAPMSGQARHARGILGPDLLRPVFGVVAGSERAFQGHKITLCSACPRAETGWTASCPIAARRPSRHPAGPGVPWSRTVSIGHRLRKPGRWVAARRAVFLLQVFRSDHSTPRGPAPFGAPEPPDRIDDRAVGVDPASRWSSQTSHSASAIPRASRGMRQTICSAVSAK